MISNRLDSLLSPFRLEAVKRTGLLTEMLPGEYDRLLHLSCRCLAGQASAFLLLTEDGFHCLGSVGLPPGLSSLAVWPAEWPHLLEAVFEGPVFISGSEPADPADSPTAGPAGPPAPEFFPGAAFPAFAGHPLMDAQGNRLGILCVWDDKPRPWTQAQIEILDGFAGAIGDLLQRRREEVSRRDVPGPEAALGAGAAQAKHLRYLEAVDSVARVLERAEETGRELPRALERVLDVLGGSRIWLIHPADSSASDIRAPFAVARRGVGEAPAPGGPLPGGMPVSELLREALADDLLVYGPSAGAGAAARSLPDPGFWRDAFGADKALSTFMRPHVGKPWLCLILRSSEGPAWTDEDIGLFKDIASRICGFLGGMILYRDLRRSEENYRTLFERSLDGIYRCAPDGILLDGNPALISMLGYADRKELVGTVQKQLLPMEGAKISTPDRGEAFSVELRRKDGTSLWAEVNSQAIRRADGDLGYFEGMVRNINDRKRAEDALKASEEKLRQSQKMEAVGRLAGGVAHDFNNLLTAINGFSDLLLMTVPPEDERRNHVEEIRKAGERAASLTGQLLAFSRKQVLAPRLLDLNAVVAGMETMLRRLIGENINFRIRAGADLGKVVADPGQVEQIILNLALNSRDAMPGGGELTISTGKAELGPEGPVTLLEAPPGEYLELSVSDTGSGMDEETRARLFEPFFTTKSKDKGTGLGLSMVYGAVKYAGGTLAVESALGRGTIFRVYLRVAGTAEEIREPVRRGKRPENPQGTETILLVEDEDAVRRLVRDVLKSNGYTVLDAPGGEEALEIARRHAGRIHLLLTDVVMAGMNGRELSERLQKLRPETKVLYMSGYTEDSIIRHGVMSAHTAFIGKPFSPAALSAKVREVLGVAAVG